MQKKEGNKIELTAGIRSDKVPQNERVACECAEAFDEAAASFASKCWNTGSLGRDAASESCTLSPATAKYEVGAVDCAPPSWLRKSAESKMLPLNPSCDDGAKCEL